jgi:hypothetical protein
MDVLVRFMAVANYHKPDRVYIDSSVSRPPALARSLELWPSLGLGVGVYGGRVGDAVREQAGRGDVDVGERVAHLVVAVVVGLTGEATE